MIKGKWRYLYRAVEKSGETVEFLLCENRNKKAAKRFLKKLIDRNGKPSLINIDKSGANYAAIASLNKETGFRIKVRQCKYFNNVVEQSHRFVKRKMRQTMGFEGFHSASATLAGLELWRMI